MASLEPIVKAFIAADKNNDGSLDKAEVVQLFKSYGKNEQWSVAWLNHFDTNKDGKISFKEFIAMAGYKDQEAESLLKALRQDGQGNISKIDGAIQILQDHMPSEMKKKVTDQFKQLVDQGKDLHEIAPAMQAFLGQGWSVFVINGSYAAAYQHVAFASLSCMYMKKSLVVMRGAQ